MDTLPKHNKYTLCDIKEADAVAYAFIDKTSPPIQYPFKFYPLEDTEIRIKQLYTGLCASDMLFARQSWGPCKYPCCPGHEILGEVTMVGSKVTKWKIGDRVGFSPTRNHCKNCAPCKNGKDHLCIGMSHDAKNTFSDEFFGGYATHYQGQELHAFKIPEKLPSKETPPLLCAGITLYAPIKRYLKKGKECAIVGIGGLGHLGVMFASKLGMNVTAFSTSPDKSEMIKALGAYQIKSSIDQNVLQQEQQKYDLVIETIYTDKAEILNSYMKLTKPGGVYVLLGVGADSKMSFNVQYVVGNQITIAGSVVGNITDIEEMLEICAEKNILPMVEEFSFENFPKAFDTLENGKPKFRCVVNIHEWSKKNGLFK